GLRDLLGRLKPGRAPATRQSAARAYWWLLGLYLGGAALYLVATVLLGGSASLDRVLGKLGGNRATPAGNLLLGPLIDEGGTPEELGWRGFALPLLMDRFQRPLVASLVLGVGWWGWHLPREVPTLIGGTAIGPWLWDQAQFLGLCVA